MKRVAVFFSFFILWMSCSSTYHDAQIELIYKSINMMKRLDTLGLKSIVDTSYCYDIYGPEGFENIVQLTSRKINTCGLPEKEKLSSVVNNQLHYTEYTMPFCRNHMDSLTSESFDLIFRFFDYEKNDKIGFININKSPWVKKPKPTKSLPQ